MYFCFPKDALQTFFRKLVWFIQLLILNTITKLYPSGGITTFCTEKPLYLYNVTRTRKIQFNSTCSDGKGKLTSEVCCCHWHYRWKYKRNLNQKNNLTQELETGAETWTARKRKKSACFERKTFYKPAFQNNMQFLEFTIFKNQTPCMTVLQ